MPSPVPIEAAKQPIEMCSCCCVSPPSKSVYLEELIVRQRVQFLSRHSGSLPSAGNSHMDPQVDIPPQLVCNNQRTDTVSVRIVTEPDVWVLRPGQWHRPLPL